MVLWLLAIAVTAIACAALYYAASGVPVNAAAGTAGAAGAATTDHFRLQLREIESDVAAGRLAAGDARVAEGELAREYLRSAPVTEAGAGTAGPTGRAWLLPALIAVAGLSFGTYALLGSPDLPSLPLDARPEAAAQPLDLNDAIARIERQLADRPDDLRGWTVIAPAYMELQRYADAERAYRRMLALAPPTADTETDLAVALLMQNGGRLAGEPLALLQKAAARDSGHVRARFYLAAEATRSGDYASAKAQWTELLALATGDEPWVAVAKEGLAAAETGLSGAAAAPPDAAAILAMVDGLDARLAASGGTLAEWTQLVQSRLVLNDRAAARRAYDDAVAAYPDAAARTELDALARDNGLTGGAP